MVCILYAINQNVWVSIDYNYLAKVANHSFIYILQISVKRKRIGSNTDEDFGQGETLLCECLLIGENFSVDEIA